MTKKRLLVLVGGEWHPFEQCAALITDLLEATGRYTVQTTADRDVLKGRTLSRFDGLLVYTSGGKLTTDQEAGLLAFVNKGGSFIGLHCAAASWAANKGYVDMLGGTFATHSPYMEFPVNITKAQSPITARIQNFRTTDELYILDKFNPDNVRTLATATWKGKEHPIAYTKTFGKGNVFFLALGHDENSLSHPEFRKMLCRGVDWTFRRTQGKPLKVGTIGYGASFKMGKLHIESLRDAAGFEPVAVCDLVPERRAEAETDFPGIKTYASATRMLDKQDLDLVVVITEHFSHAKIAIQCLNAGRHVVTEKPFCVTVKQADEMIATARRNKRMLSVFHNRRWDGDYMTIKDAIARNLIGDVFHIEATMGSYNHPSYWWRSDKHISGGAFYDWGAHIVDWVLGLVPANITEVAGFFQEKRVWHDVTNEDHCNAVVRFDNGCCANIELSSLASVRKPRWRILGTLGGLVDIEEKKLGVTSFKEGIRMDSQLDYRKSDWHAYYRNVADHLLLGEPLAVTPESARRVIAVIETSEKSSRAGKAMPVPKHAAKP